MTLSQSPPFFPVRFQGPKGRVSRAPIRPRTHPTQVFAAVVATTPRAGAPPEAPLRAGCARLAAVSRDHGGCGGTRGSAAEKRRGAGGRGGRGEVSGTKATRGKGERQGEHPETRGCPGRGGVGPASWVSGPGGHAAIHALKPRAEIRGLETRALPGVKARTLSPQAAPLLQKRVQSQTHELGNIRT